VSFSIASAGAAKCMSQYFYSANHFQSSPAKEMVYRSGVESCKQGRIESLTPKHAIKEGEASHRLCAQQLGERSSSTCPGKVVSKPTACRSAGNDVIDESERLRPEALDQRNIELLLAESNLVSWSMKKLFCLIKGGWSACPEFKGRGENLTDSVSSI
jgi:hypothetical protein